jgi:hypothetical protein
LSAIYTFGSFGGSPEKVGDGRGGRLMNIPHTFESYQMIRATYGQKMMEFGLIEVL